MHIRDAISKLFTGHSSSWRTDKAHPQTQAAHKRMTHGSAGKPPSLEAHRIQAQSAQPLRAKRQQEVRKAVTAADQKLSGVLAAVLLGQQKHVKQCLNELVTELTPLSENVAQEIDTTAHKDPKTAHEDHKASVMFDMVGRLTANKIGEMSAKELDILGKSLQALQKNDPNPDGLMGFLAAAISAAGLLLQVKEVEAGGLKFGGSKPSDFSQMSLSDLRELNDMRGTADDLAIFFDVLPRGKTYSGTQLTPNRLRVIQDQCIAAETELNRREKTLTIDGSPALLNTMQRGELVKLNDAINDWLDEFPSHVAMTAVQSNVQERLKSLDAEITQSVLGTAETLNLKRLHDLKGKELVGLKNGMPKQGNLPPALLKAQDMVNGEIALRKTAAQVKFVHALTAAMGEADTGKRLAQLLACATLLNGSRVVLTNLGEELTPATISAWIERALRYVDVNILESAQTDLTALLQSKPFQQTLAANTTPRGKIHAQYLDLLSKQLPRKG